MTDVPKANDATPPPKDTPSPNVAADAIPAPGVKPTTTTVADNTASQHLPNIGIDQPYNPYNIPGTYDPKDIASAKAKGFNADEVHGAHRFHDTMNYLDKRPDQVQNVKNFADGSAYLQNNPDAIFNPLNQPGQYRPDAINFGKQAGFNPDEMHVLEQWGPTNFNGIMDYLKANPNQVDNFKKLADGVGYWETHPDMPLDPKATTNQYSPDAVKFGQQAGFNNNQMKVLGQWGADNFNNTMAYLSKNPDQIANMKNLANAVGLWESQMVMPPQPGPQGQQKR
jgi:hypothetical protein